MTLKVYCEKCRKSQLFKLDNLIKDKLNDKPWADLCCIKCHLVVATFSADKNCKMIITQQELKNESEMKQMNKITKLRLYFWIPIFLIFFFILVKIYITFNM